MENATYESDADEDIGSDEDNDKEKAKIRSEEYTTAHDTTFRISSECNEVLMFLQAVTLKAPRVLAAPI